jgi:uncharacterized membrane protein
VGGEGWDARPWPAGEAQSWSGPTGSAPAAPHWAAAPPRPGPPHPTAQPWTAVPNRDGQPWTSPTPPEASPRTYSTPGYATPGQSTPGPPVHGSGPVAHGQPGPGAPPAAAGGPVVPTGWSGDDRPTWQVRAIRDEPADWDSGPAPSQSSGPDGRPPWPDPSRRPDNGPYERGRPRDPGPAHDPGHPHDHAADGGEDDEGWDDDEDDEAPPRRRGGHGHGHGPLAKVSTHTKRIVLAILIPCAIATVAGLVLLWPGKVAGVAQGDQGTDQRAYGTVLTINETPCQPGPSLGPGANTNQPCGVASIRIDSGAGSNSTVAVDLPQGPGAPTLAIGDRVVLAFTPAAGGSPDTYDVIDHQRGQPLVYMLALCGAIIVVFGRLRGFTALIGLGLSFGLLLVFILPGILNGESPLLVAIVGSAAIMFAVLYLTHGFNVHTSVAVLGTLASLVVTGGLGYAFTAALKLTGFGSEESVYLSVLQGNVDMRGLLLAGIIIGALGVLDDMTVTQATTVAELAQGGTSRIEVYRAATRVGRAHVASAVNTIVMAYAGASLPLLLLVAVGGRDISDLLTSEFLTQEILRSAVGTIGLVAAVPITTALASLVADIRPRTAARPRAAIRPRRP